MPLVENEEDDEYFYLVSVVTGVRIGAGTTSNVFLFLNGESGRTPARALYDGERKVRLKFHGCFIMVNISVSNLFYTVV